MPGKEGRGKERALRGRKELSKPFVPTSSGERKGLLGVTVRRFESQHGAGRNASLRQPAEGMLIGYTELSRHHLRGVHSLAHSCTWLKEDIANSPLKSNLNHSL